jgi:glycosyltransferase involved in cell wall biosynthesis
MQTKYIIISPVRDEEKHIEKTINSIIAQSIRPAEWIIVNDGSQDNTGIIIDKYAEQYNWIKAVHRPDRGVRVAGSGVIEAFYAGYERIQTNNWEYIIKLDGDLSFEADYFKKCFEYFMLDKHLGVGGGDIYNIIDDVPVLEKNPKFHVRGATKIYRREAWEDIGELIKAPGWDTLDEVKANMMGWKSYSFSDLKVYHYRVTGGADGQWRSSVKDGLANYITGYHPLFMIIKCMIRVIREKPFMVDGLGHLYGFIKGYVTKVPQIDNKDLIAYVRKQQIYKITFRRSIWN